MRRARAERKGVAPRTELMVEEGEHQKLRRAGRDVKPAKSQSGGYGTNAAEHRDRAVHPVKAEGATAQARSSMPADRRAVRGGKDEQERCDPAQYRRSRRFPPPTTPRRWQRRSRCPRGRPKRAGTWDGKRVSGRNVRSASRSAGLGRDRSRHRSSGEWSASAKGMGRPPSLKEDRAAGDAERRTGIIGRARPQVNRG